jgi:glycerophosphoryl diester phosphodiesterase
VNLPLSIALLLAWTGVPGGRTPGAQTPQPESVVSAVSPLPQAHSHNDYAHTLPLFEALEQGFCSVEADVFVVDGQLLVAHDRWAVRPERTLQALYLEPLRERVRAGGGRVWPGIPTFHLLIDLKTPAETTYNALRPVLLQYTNLLTCFRGETTETNAVTVVLSGNEPRAQLLAEPARWAALDGRQSDLGGRPSRHFIPWISESWPVHFKWSGQGEMPPDEQTRLREWVARAHADGRQVRFWGENNAPGIWREQSLAGVDLINADKLAELRQFLRPGQ